MIKNAGKRKWISRQAHNLKVVGSSPTPASKVEENMLKKNARRMNREIYLGDIIS